jgi:hypothetical protein
MLLVGNEILNTKINRQHERLFRRIKARHEQRPLARGEQKELLAFMGYSLGEDEFDFVWKLVGGRQPWLRRSGPRHCPGDG